MSTITLTRAEFIQLVQRIQNLALMNAYIYIPGMTMRGVLNISEELQKIATPNQEYISKPYKPRTNRSDAERQIICDLYNKGMNVFDIAAKCNCTHDQITSQIAYMRRKHGIEIAPYRKRRFE